MAVSSGGEPRSDGNTPSGPAEAVEAPLQGLTRGHGSCQPCMRAQGIVGRKVHFSRRYGPAGALQRPPPRCLPEAQRGPNPRMGL
jgi:hypothetical protein